jgi:hypothetical protein
MANNTVASARGNAEKKLEGETVAVGESTKCM